MTELIVARTVQGLGAAMVLPLSLTILTTAFPPEKRGMIVGVYGGLAGLAVALGPIVGGAITEGIDWHWIFWINVPIGVAAVLLGRRLLPESHGAPERLDLVGVTLVTAGVVALVWALTRANDVGWTSAEIVGTWSAAACCSPLFLCWEHRAAEPMVPLRLFASREFAVGNLTTYFLHGATFSAAFFITQEFQLARGYSPLGTGLRLLPFFATPMIVSPIAGSLSDRIGRRPIMFAGLVLQAVGYRLGRRPRLALHQLDRARRRPARGGHRDLDGPPHRARHRAGRGRSGGDGQSVWDQLHGAALRHRVRARDRKRGVCRPRSPRQPRRRHRGLPAGALGVRLLRRPRGPERHRDQRASRRETPTQAEPAIQPTAA